MNFDLAELRGYSYHTGIVFAAFVEGQGAELARGGRYDSVGEAFGKSRAACGFSADLRLIARLGSKQTELRQVIAAPADDSPGLAALVNQLRQSGKRVVTVFADGDMASYTQSIQLKENQWVVV